MLGAIAGSLFVVGSTWMNQFMDGLWAILITLLACRCMHC
jgi:hypothetical protein